MFHIVCGFETVYADMFVFTLSIDGESFGMALQNFVWTGVRGLEWTSNGIAT